jgi:plastocyanin
MQNRWLLIVLVIALVMTSGCADDQAETEDTTEGQTGITAEEQNAEDAPASAVEAMQYGVRMDYTYFSPAVLDLNRGDTVTWRNNNKQKVYTLISDDGLFGDQEMKYGNTFYHIFENGGTYSFSVKDTPEMTMTVNVR